MLTVDFGKFPVLNTGRLTLRQVQYDDARDIFLLRSNPAVMEFIDRPLATSTEDAYQLIQKISESFSANDGINWAITLQTAPQLIGTIGFWRIEKEHFRAEIGYMLNPAYQGKGLMQEAITAVIDYGFNVLKLHSIEANVNPGNTGSIKILEKNEFVREAYHKENFYYNGKFLDSAIYSLISKV